MAEFLLGAVLGLAAGYWLSSRRRANRTPRIYPVTVATRQMVYLREFGTLPIDRAHALASRIARGQAVRYRSLVGKGKLLRRSEWDRIVSGEMVARGLLRRAANRTLAPSPEFVTFCQHLIAHHARTAHK